MSLAYRAAVKDKWDISVIFIVIDWHISHAQILAIVTVSVFAHWWNLCNFILGCIIRPRNDSSILTCWVSVGPPEELPKRSSRHKDLEWKREGIRKQDVRKVDKQWIPLWTANVYQFISLGIDSTYVVYIMCGVLEMQPRMTELWSWEKQKE